MACNVDSTSKTAPTPGVHPSRSAVVPTAQIAPSKSETIIKLMSRAKGATSAELVTATGWQAHSMRAFFSGLRKSGRTIVREARKDGELSYRIERTPAAKPSDADIPGTATDGFQVENA